MLTAVAAAGCDDQSTRPSDAGADAALDDGGAPLDAPQLDAPLSATCLEATQHSDLAWIQDRIFTPSCAAFTDCHRGATPPAGLSLEAGRARPNLVGVQSRLFPAYQRVAAGTPQNSYLLFILGHIPGPLAPNIGTMPYNSPLLCAEKRQAIERWIAAGAPP